jgi:zinc protease
MKQILFTLLFSFTVLSTGLGQEAESNKALPIDENVRIGQLDNGFIYYIRQNAKPENRIELRLAVNAGSILETEKQLGLAHLLEHMAFNGTKHFEKNELIAYLQSIGVRFGPDLNAYTSFDETVYMLTIPSDSTDLVNKGFLVMEDWAFNQSLVGEEIDKERGVVIEEWRMGRGPQKRMLDKNFPVIFKDSRYAERLPIGKKEVLETFTHEDIRSFYHDWYRPDLMALVVVGDIDPDVAEQKIKEHFSSAKNPSPSKERKNYDVPDHEGTLVSIATDKEAPYTLVQLMYKTDAKEYTTESDYLQMVKEACMSGMLNRRLQELTESADPPFLNVGFYYGSLLSRNKNALQGYALVSETGIERGLAAMLEENNRIDQFGFTQGELDRFKLDYLTRMEGIFNERDKTESEALAMEYVRNYLENEPIPGIEFEYNFVKENIDKVTLEDVNNLAASIISTSNRIIVVNGPEKEALTTLEEATLLAVAADVDKKELTAYEDKLASAELMANIPVAGSIVKEEQIESIEAAELHLSNGVRVLLKPTAFKNDEVLVSGYAWGGNSMYGMEDYHSALHSDAIIAESGVAEFSPSDLTKVLAGKTVNASNSFTTYSQGTSASCRADDVETMLQLMHLKFTQPRVDEEAFNAYIAKNKGFYQNLGQDPRYYFYDAYTRLLSQDHPRGDYLPSVEDLDKVDFSRAVEIYNEVFSNANGYTFIFVGAFEIEQLKPLLEKYVASLPAADKPFEYTDLGIRPPIGMITKNFYKGTEPKSTAVMSFSMETAYDKTDAFLLKQLAQLLNRKFYEVIREELSGAYNIRTNASIEKVPYERAQLSITIPCSPENAEMLLDAAMAQIKEIQNNGVETADIEKSKEIYRRDKEKNLQKNGWWLNALTNSYIYNLGFESIASYEALDLITSEELQRVANKYLNTEEYIRVVLYPEDYSN